MHPVLMAFLLTLLAGLATGIGSIIAFAAPRTNYRFLSVATGFSTGVMLYVSFVEIMPKGLASLAAIYGEGLAHWINVGSFFCGILLIGLIDALIPASDNPHEAPSQAEMETLHEPLALSHNQAQVDSNSQASPALSSANNNLMRMGLFTALAIGIHNFPEGLATFLAALEDPRLGMAIAIAIALHNIPEGISVSVPIYYATGNRRKAFCLSLLSGLAEPMGALLAYFGLRLFTGSGTEALPPQFMGLLFAGVAGIMVYISLDELLPTSRAYGKGHDSLIGLVGGMLVMALSLLLMQ